MNDDWLLLLSIVIPSIVAGLAIVQLFKFKKVNGKLRIALDERPVSRVILAVVVIAFVAVVIRLITIDVDTRDCIERLQDDRTVDQCY